MGLIEILPDDEIVPIFIRLLYDASELLSKADEADLLKLTRIIIEFEALYGNEIPDTIYDQLIKVCEICKKILNGQKIDKKLDSNLKPIITLAIALRGGDLNEIIENEFDAIDLILEAKTFLEKYRMLEGRALANLAVSIAEITLKFINNLDNYILATSLKTFILASLMHDRTLPIKFFSYYKAVLDTIKNQYENLYYLSQTFMIKIVGYMKDVEILESFLEKLEDIEENNYILIKRLAEVRIQLLKGNFIEAGNSIEKILCTIKFYVQSMIQTLSHVH